jgi:hypothetical protein
MPGARTQSPLDCATLTVSRTSRPIEERRSAWSSPLHQRQTNRLPILLHTPIEQDSVIRSYANPPAANPARAGTGGLDSPLPPSGLPPHCRTHMIRFAVQKSPSGWEYLPNTLIRGFEAHPIVTSVPGRPGPGASCSKGIRDASRDNMDRSMTGIDAPLTHAGTSTYVRDPIMKG